MTKAELNHTGNHSVLSLRVASGRRGDPGSSSLILYFPDLGSWSDIAIQLNAARQEAERYACRDILARCQGEAPHRVKNVATGG